MSSWAELKELPIDSSHEALVAGALEEVFLDLLMEYSPNFSWEVREYVGYEDAGIDPEGFWRRRLALSDQQREIFDRLVLDWFQGRADATQEQLESWFTIASLL